MPAYSTHYTEQISCVQMQRSFCYAACRLTVPSTAPRLFTSGTHSTTLSRCVLLLRDAPNNTIAPRLFLFGSTLSSSALRTPRSSLFSHLRPHAVILLLPCVPTQLGFTAPASVDTFPSLCLRTWIDSRLQE